MRHKIEYSVQILASGIKCWICDSIGDNKNDFCNDPFDENKVTEEQKRMYYADCDKTCGKIVGHKNCMY